MSLKSVFQNVEKQINSNKIIEKMDLEISATISQIDIITPSNIIPNYEINIVATNIEIPMCTADQSSTLELTTKDVDYISKSNDKCPIRFENGDICINQSNTDDNTYMCIQKLNSFAPSDSSNPINFVDTVSTTSSVSSVNFSTVNFAPINLFSPSQ